MESCRWALTVQTFPAVEREDNWTTLFSSSCESSRSSSFTRWVKDGLIGGTLLSFPVPLDQKITMSGLWKKSSCNVETLTMERLDAQLVSLHSSWPSNRDSWFVSYRYPIFIFRTRDQILDLQQSCRLKDRISCPEDVKKIGPLVVKLQYNDESD